VSPVALASSHCSRAHQLACQSSCRCCQRNEASQRMPRFLLFSRSILRISASPVSVLMLAVNLTIDLNQLPIVVVASEYRGPFAREMAEFRFVSFSLLHLTRKVNLAALHETGLNGNSVQTLQHRAFSPNLSADRFSLTHTRSQVSFRT